MNLKKNKLWIWVVLWLLQIILAQAIGGNSSIAKQKFHHALLRSRKLQPAGFHYYPTLYSNPCDGRIVSFFDINGNRMTLFGAFGKCFNISTGILFERCVMWYVQSSFYIFIQHYSSV